MKLLSAGLVTGLFLLLLDPANAQSQRLPMSVQSFDNMDDLRPAADNWQIVGSVAADRNTAGDISTTAGMGILVNIPTEASRGNMFFDWEHGDIELELEFMMPKGSNAGIYLQGRYEVQMFDSWGVSRPTFADAGGIYQRWDPSRPAGLQGFDGHPPQMNVSRAPGLWQQFKIRFQAPRFDASGHKIANAKFISVEQNGVVIHENIELTGPTRAAAFSDEAAMGPIMIQGDHGPVAIRNVRYNRYEPNLITTSNTRFQYAEGVFESLPIFDRVMAKTEGDVQGIDWRVREVNDQFAVRFKGDINIPYSGRYRFQLGLDWVRGDPHDLATAIGSASFMIGTQSIIIHEGEDPVAQSDIDLTAGTFPFELVYFKNRAGRPQSFSLLVEGGGMPLHSLNAAGSLPSPPSVGSIFVVPTQEPELIRGFVNHGGEKKTHTIAVGHASDVHYTMDLSQGSMLHAWKGSFIEATDMWHSRGTAQLAVPLGSVLTFSGNPTVAHLGSENATWPDSMETGYRFEGYDLDEAGHPTFKYSVNGAAVTDRLLPENSGRELWREITLVGEADGFWVLAAAGESITQLADGTYSIDDNTYFISVPDTGGGKAIIRTVSSGQELVIPLSSRDGQAIVRYALIW